MNEKDEYSHKVKRSATAIAAAKRARHSAPVNSRQASGKAFLLFRRFFVLDKTNKNK